jgi:pimeloyl-ACP methyl ester carboxylesterase
VIILLFFLRAAIHSRKIEEIYADSQSQFIEIDGLRIHYKNEGEGEAILLLHGTAASLHTWDGWTEKLKYKNRVIRFDLPAYGLTGPHPEADYSLDSYLGIIDGFADSLGLDSFTIAGNSFGGQLSWLYAANNQERVSKLILIDPSGIPTNREKPWIFKLAQTPVLNLILRYVTPKWFIINNLKQVMYDDSKISEEMINRYFDLSLKEGNRRAFIDRLKSEYPDRSDELKQIECPTLILWGNKDVWIPHELGEKYRNAIPDSRLEVFDKLGHIPMEEDPERTVKSVQEFLRK